MLPWPAILWYQITAHKSSLLTRGLRTKSGESTIWFPLGLGLCRTLLPSNHTSPGKFSIFENSRYVAMCMTILPSVSFHGYTIDASAFSITAIFLGTALLAFVVHRAFLWYRLSHIPGPFWAAFSKYWMVTTSLRGRQPTAIKEVTDKYGKLRLKVRDMS